MNDLTYGYNEGLVPGTRAAWGARAIVTQDGTVDLVWNRQSELSDDPDRNLALHTWLDGGTSPLHHALRLAEKLLNEGVLQIRIAEGHVLYSDREGAILANTNGSGGYLYLVAYRFADLPEGHATRGFETVMADTALEAIAHTYTPDEPAYTAYHEELARRAARR